MRVLLAGEQGQLGSVLEGTANSQGVVLAPRPQAFEAFRPDFVLNRAAYTAVVH